MPSGNAELVRRAVQAVNDRDADRMVQLIAEGFEWVTPVPSIEPRLYRGADGVRQFFADARAWEHIEARIDEIRDLDNRALVLGELTWHGRGGALDVTGPLASVIDFAGGKIKRIQTYRDANDAWTAAGLGRTRP